MCVSRVFLASTSFASKLEAQLHLYQLFNHSLATTLSPSFTTTKPQHVSCLWEPTSPGDTGHTHPAFRASTANSASTSAACCSSSSKELAEEPMAAMRRQWWPESTIASYQRLVTFRALDDQAPLMTSRFNKAIYTSIRAPHLFACKAWNCSCFSPNSRQSQSDSWGNRKWCSSWAPTI